MRLTRFPFVHETFAMGTEGQVIHIEQCHLRAQYWFLRQGRLHRRADRGHAAIAAHARNHFAFMAKQIFRHIPAAIDFANNLVLGHNNIVEKCLAERRVARDQLDRLGRNTRSFHVEQQEAYSLIFVRLVGADQTENPVGLIRIRGPDFLAIDDPMVSLILAKGLHRHKVAA